MGKGGAMSKWKIDPDHSCAAFGIRHLALAHVRGHFTGIKGFILFDPQDRSRGEVSVEIDVAGVDTGVRKRDEHLLTADFFDQPNFPLIAFRSTRIDFLDGNICRVTGQLSIHGITLSVSFEGEYAGPRGNPFGDEMSIGFSGSIVLNREDFGMLWGSEPMEGGGLIAGREVRITLDLEADLMK